MNSRKIRVTCDSPPIRVKIDPYEAVRDAVSTGVAFGWRGVWKHRHDDDPGEEVFVEARERITDEVMHSLCELLDFPQEVDL